MLTLWILFWVANCEFAKLYTYVSNNVSTTETTNILPTKEDPGKCECDLTSNSCDAYWCWDYDWGSVRSTWDSQGFCRDEAEDVALPFNDWLDSGDVKRYNVDLGEYSYAGPVTRLLWIFYNNYPPTNVFYDTKTSVSNDEVTDLTNSEVTFGTKLFTTESTASNDYYSIDDPMDALFTDSTGATSVLYFRLPKPNFSGLWNYYKPALYLQPEETVCVGELVMDQTTWEGPNFNPYYFYSAIQLITNPQSSSTNVAVDTTTATHYLIDVDGNYTANATLGNSTFTAGTPATCTNHVKEIYYTFTYTQRTSGDLSGFLDPTGVRAQFIMQTTSSSTPVRIVQKFYTLFEIANASGDVFYRSGNIGYLYMRDLLVGNLNSTNSGINLSQDGYRMQPSTGAWAVATSVENSILTDTDVVLKFGENYTTSCYLSSVTTDFATFSSFCTGLDLSSYEIFDNLNDFAYVGKFGNANVNYIQDWVTVESVDLTYSNNTVNDTLQFCSLVTDVEVQILYSKVGFPDNQHSYIVATRKKGITRQVYFNSYKIDQRIDLKVSFEFVEITEEEGSTSAYEPRQTFTWPSDIFYPFFTLDNAYLNNVKTAIGLCVGFILTMMIFS